MAPDSSPSHGYAPDRYGASFAEVYDDWYPADDATSAAVEAISALAGPGGAVLELGVGTGRLAIPLVELGHPVTGLDASEPMLAALTAKRSNAAPTAGELTTLLGDVADPDAWPAGPFRVVVAAFNLIGNLLDPDQQARVVRCAATVLGPDGVLVVESNEPTELSDDAARLDVRSVTEDGVVLIATRVDAGTGVITGQHIELSDGELPRLRPWKVRLCTATELDDWAGSAGLVLAERRNGWDGEGTSTVSVYRAR